jgi:hypothetical protein
MPGGQAIRQAGASPEIRVLPGDMTGAEEMFDKLTPQGGKDVAPSGHSGIVEAPNGGGFVGFRPKSQSGQPTLDVNIPGVPIEKLKLPLGR